MVPQILRSRLLEEIVKSRTEAAYDQADGNCTAGYDNDGSTGLEIFQNGLHMGALANKECKDIFYAVVRLPDSTDQVAFFVLAGSEYGACERAKEWEVDED